ncbi:probable RNA-binding protein 46 isoform X2 [Tigriopus californicus]|uniref:probable RNA-binding protein 46 isoform X2 n=1 Tax=Tigriopus californicus TaxID=6832 RepID=UPI0027DA066E|nr:probable RNA-binding protein 46 isoform X2 [Tigriopus californicus]|eukprot:TCALIF_03809-PA protein Name:"Similar to A1CF APOBEC1 complementation factor (Homo sapiens)" AED:0.14 eAED:0.14 QI:263/1/1/1/0.71/0.62/8/383/614
MDLESALPWYHHRAKGGWPTGSSIFSLASREREASSPEPWPRPPPTSREWREISSGDSDLVDASGGMTRLMTGGLQSLPERAMAAGRNGSLWNLDQNEFSDPPLGAVALRHRNENQIKKSNDERLLDLVDKTSYQIVQRNGQRIYGGPPPGWVGPSPDKGCEIFVGKVPRDCFEDELVPIFSQIGQIYELRLMMDFSGSNRGFLFIRYTSSEHAKMAVKKFNNYEIRPNRHLGVVKSVDNRKLWISGIPKNQSAEQIKIEMEHLTEGVREVILYPSQMDKSKTRGYAFVEYESHRLAALARRKLVPGRIFLLGQEIEKVDWAEPETEVDDEVMSKVRILFVRNLMPETSENDIKEKFEELGGETIERVKKNKDYAFVHFVTREAAELALEKAQDLSMDGAPLHVTWSKPVDKLLYNQRKQLTKLFSEGTPSISLSNNLGIPPSNIPFYESPLAQLNPFTPSFPPHPLLSNPSNRGAPGTAPPRRLVKMSAFAGPGSHPQPSQFGNNGFGLQNPMTHQTFPYGYPGLTNHDLTYPHYFPAPMFSNGYMDPSPNAMNPPPPPPVMGGSSGSSSSHGSPNPGSMNHLNESHPMMGHTFDSQHLVNAMHNLALNGGTY